MTVMWLETAAGMGAVYVSIADRSDTTEDEDT